MDTVEDSPPLPQQARRAVLPETFAQLKAGLRQQIDDGNLSGNGSHPASPSRPMVDVDEEELDRPTFLRPKLSRSAPLRMWVHPDDISDSDSPDPAKSNKKILEGGAIFADDSALPGLEQVPAERRPLVSKIGNGLKAILVAQKENLTHVRGRETEWYLGVLAGSAISVSFQAATLNPAISTGVKVGLNAAVGLGGTHLLERGYRKERESLYNNYSGEELKQRITALEDRHQKATGRLKNFLLGMSAGATYTSVATLGFHALGGDQLVSSLANKVGTASGSFFEPAHTVPAAAPTPENFHIPTPTAEPTTAPTLEPTPVPTLEPTQVPTAVPTAVPTVVPPVHEITMPDYQIPHAVVTPTAQTPPVTMPDYQIPHVVLPQASTPPLQALPPHEAALSTHLGGAATPEPSSPLSPEQIATKGVTPEFSAIVAPHVGEHLNMTTQAVNEALTAQGIDPSQVSVESYEQMRLAVQHQMEAYGNESFAQASREAVANGNMDMTHVSDRGAQLLNESLNSTGHHNKLVQMAHDVLSKQVSENNQIHETIQNAVKNLSPEDASQHLIKGSETFSQMAQEAGHPLTYHAIPADADYVGAHAMANFDKISTFQNQVAHAVGFSDSYHLPFSQAELPGVIEQARNGDQAAMNKLIAFWKYWPANDSITQLSDKGVDDILKAAGVPR